MNYIKSILIVVTAGALIMVGYFISDKNRGTQLLPRADKESNEAKDENDIFKNILILDLSSTGLDAFSIDTIRKYKNSTELNLSGNNIRTLPAEIGEMEKLTVLNLENNRLDSLPAEIRKMTRLESLDISNNNISGVPAEIGQLKNLKLLDLSQNQIDALPMEIFNLTEIEKIDLSGNRITEEKIEELRIRLPRTEIIFE
jgi:Leucine-rich repeat (LRR) protein